MQDLPPSILLITSQVSYAGAAGINSLRHVMQLSMNSVSFQKLPMTKLRSHVLVPENSPEP